MKYFEVYEPYYALIKEESKEKAMKVYVEFVASDEGTLKDEMYEVSRTAAWRKFCNGENEDGSKSLYDELVKQFNDPDNKVLLIDSALL